MLKKVVRWLLVLLSLIVILLIGAGVALHHYLDSGKERILTDLADATGLEVAFREFDYAVWKTFPHVSVSVDSLVIHDRSRPKTEPALLRAGKLEGSISIRKILRDTLELTSFKLSNGGIFITRDSLGKPNFGRLTEARDTTREPEEASWADPAIDWNGVELDLREMDVSFRHDHRHKRMEMRLDSLLATAETDARGHLRFLAEIGTHVGGIAFNTRKGSYLTGASLGGKAEIIRSDSMWRVEPTTVTIDQQRFTFSAEIDRGATEELRLKIANDATNYEATRRLLPDILREKLGRYAVEGSFPVQATIVEQPATGREPDIDIDFALTGRDLRILDYNFRDVYTSGTFQNRLPPREGGLAGSPENLRIELAATRGYQGRLYVQTPHAIIRGTAADTRLEAPLRLSGPAELINDRVGTEDFIFQRGRFTLETHVSASLNSVDEIITTSDGSTSFRNLSVLYRPAGIRFPLRHLNLSKRADDIRFDLQTDTLKTGFIFNMNGRLDNLLPLLRDRPAERVRTDLSLRAPYIGWRDFLALFGEDGVLRSEEPISDQQRKLAMKTALLGLRSTFHPRVEAHFDSLGYYDVFTVTDFSTGMHFDGDTLVLEETGFNWEGSQVAFDARLGLASGAMTPFRVGFEASRLDANRLSPTFEYFGMQLPAGLDALPRDLNVDFWHRGIINDTFGIAPGFNRGALAFDDGAESLFTGRLDYGPTAAGLQSHLRLNGDPRAVNAFFAAENFFFGSGTFRIALDVTGLPQDLNELISGATLSLAIDSSRVLYLPTGASLPVRSFRVNAREGRTDYDLRLFSDAQRKEVHLHGTLDRLSAFLYPDSGQTYRVTTDATAGNLHWGDLRDFFQRDSMAAGTVSDTTAGDAVDFLATTERIFRTFRPDLSLRIDTFWTNEQTMLTELQAGLRIRDSSQLILEESGFRLGAGKMELTANYGLDQEAKSPFNLSWNTEALSLQKIVLALESLDLPGVQVPGDLRGLLTAKADVSGMIDEGGNRLILGESEGTLDLILRKGTIRSWPELDTIGRKLMMRKRFERVGLGPTALRLHFDGSRISLPETELQSTPLQLFLAGGYDTIRGLDLLVSIPLKNIGRGVLVEAPAPTGYALAGWKVYLVIEPGKDGKNRVKFRLGRRKYYKDRGRLEELKKRKAREKAERKAARQERKRKRT